MAHKLIKSGWLMLIIAALFLFSGCSEKHTFEKDGMSIVLTNEYEQKTRENITAYYESSKAAVIAIKEDFSSVDSSGMSSDISAAEYAGLIIASAGISTSVTEDNGAIYFEYSMNTDFGSFKYLANVYKGSDAFWLIQFSCQEDIFDDMRNDFFTFAKSVKV